MNSKYEYLRHGKNGIKLVSWAYTFDEEYLGVLNKENIEIVLITSCTPTKPIICSYQAIRSAYLSLIFLGQITNFSSHSNAFTFHLKYTAI